MELEHRLRPKFSPSHDMGRGPRKKCPIVYDTQPTFLDNHLDREKYTPCMRPSFLEHPDLDIGDMPPGLGSPASLASSGEIQGDQQPEQGDEPENPFATSQNPTKYYQSESNFSLSISSPSPKACRYVGLPSRRCEGGST